ncbi:hypothetical protein DEEACLCL_00195 [Salmonella phage CRW-SP2]|nr:hypothetical protein DEEACLCL_00195 [Salmonella phage CRW-SP2]
MSKPSYPDVVRFVAKLFSEHGYTSNQNHKKLAFDSEADFDENLEAIKNIRLKGQDLQCDDLDVIEVVMELEDEYEVDIPDEWLGRHQDNPTLGEFAALIIELTH